MKFARDLAPRIDRMRSRQRDAFPEITDESFWSLYDRCKDFSLVHVTGFYNVYQSIKYISENGIKGSFVECGCFLGGIIMFMGLLKKELKIEGADIVAFDSFSGPPVGSTDVMLGKIVKTPSLLPRYHSQTLDNIQTVVGSLGGYVFVDGLIENTVPCTEMPDVALLRLDTDFYSSTSVELQFLYPKLVSGGVLIIDDYGLFAGARRAVDEYFAKNGPSPLLNRIDQGVWAGVKP
jgi:O-methyltransferase